MSRILLRLALLVPLLMALTLLLETYGRTLPPSPDALLDICPLPCVLGMMPNITREPEVETILSFTLPATNRTILRRVTTPNVEYSFETSIGGQYIFGYVTLYPTDDRVQVVTINALFPLSVLFEKWGAPDCIQVNSYDGVPAAGVLDWRRGDYSVQALFTFQPGSVEWSSASVQSLTIRGDLPAGCRTGMQAWHGFAPAWRYQ